MDNCDHKILMALKSITTGREPINNRLLPDTSYFQDPDIIEHFTKIIFKIKSADRDYLHKSDLRDFRDQSDEDIKGIVQDYLNGKSLPWIEKKYVIGIHKVASIIVRSGIIDPPIETPIQRTIGSAYRTNFPITNKEQSLIIDLLSLGFPLSSLKGITHRNLLRTEQIQWNNLKYVNTSCNYNYEDEVEEPPFPKFYRDEDGSLHYNIYADFPDFEFLTKSFKNGCLGLAKISAYDLAMSLGTEFTEINKKTPCRAVLLKLVISFCVIALDYPQLHEIFMSQQMDLESLKIDDEDYSVEIEKPFYYTQMETLLTTANLKKDPEKPENKEHLDKIISDAERFLNIILREHQDLISFIDAFAAESGMLHNKKFRFCANLL